MLTFRHIPIYKASAFLFALLLANGLCAARPQKKPTEPDLRQYSSKQLRACFNNKRICGTGDIYSISDELARRLPALSSEQLVACFGDWKICGVEEDQASGWPISDELARRGNPHDLLMRYWSEPKWAIRDGIEHVAYHFNTPEITSFMQRALANQVYDGEELYWPVNYLAERGDYAALKELSAGRYRNQGCLQYATSVALFGRWKYRPAIPYLVDTAIYDACGNVTDAAEESLSAMYPDSPKQFENLEGMQHYFCGRAKQEGFRLNCKEK